MAVFRSETQGCHAVYAKHECFHIWVDVFQVTGSFDDAALQTWGMCNFEQWIDVVEVSLPQSEDVNRFWVKSGKINR